MKKAGIFLLLAVSFQGCMHGAWIHADTGNDDFGIFDATTYEDIRLRKGEPDVRRKAQEIRRLVNNAIAHFKAVPLNNALSDFIYNPLWRKGEIFIFVLRDDGVILAHGDDDNFIFRNLYKLKSAERVSLMLRLLAKKKTMSLGYVWNNAYKSAFIKRVKKDGVWYNIGAGFYPDDDAYTCKELVLSAAQYMDKFGEESTFAIINNPRGPLVRGDIYTFVYDFEGQCLAHGDNPALVGQVLYDQKDSRGREFIQDLIEMARKKEEGWIEYEWKHAHKRAFYKRVKDPKTNKEFIVGAGFYPEETVEYGRSQVRKAVSYLKTHGPEDAFDTFTSAVGEFTKGSLAIFAYDLNGKCLANGDFPSFVGQNLLRLRDQDGKRYIREMISIARKKDRGLITYRVKNAQAISYFEKLDTPDGKYIVGTEYFPNSKVAKTRALVRKAVKMLREEEDKDKVFNRLSQRKGGFLRGDLNIFVYNTNGVQLVNGVDKKQIYRNFIKSVDQEGQSVVADIISKGVSGGGWIEYTTRNATRRVYVESITKKYANRDPETFVVGCGYFL